LYAWGKNDNNLLGQDDAKLNKTFGTPCPVEKFSDYNVKAVSCGRLHSLIYAKKTKNKKELDSSCLFALG